MSLLYLLSLYPRLGPCSTPPAVTDTETTVTDTAVTDIAVTDTAVKDTSVTDIAVTDTAFTDTTFTYMLQSQNRRVKFVAHLVYIYFSFSSPVCQLSAVL